MKTSHDRILTTHVGSLPRPQALLGLLRARASGQPFDADLFANTAAQAVKDVVKRQASIGIDIVSDGEMPKPSFLHYVRERLSGIAPTDEALPWYLADSREVAAFPEFYKEQLERDPIPPFKRIICNAPLSYVGGDKVESDIQMFKAALADVQVSEGFLPAISPSNIAFWIRNEYYKSEEEYLFALSEAMRTEYTAITDAGLILQLDDPRLITQFTLDTSMSVKDYRAWAELRVEALNHALRGIPKEQIRFHSCYSHECGPRTTDVDLKDIVDIMLKVNAGAFSFEAANPRHEHEWKVWKDVILPDDVVLIPGVVTNSTVLVEHPELISDRILRFAEVVGKERVIAGADCGFGTFAGAMPIHETVVWAKLEALVEGARLASTKLFSRRAA